MRILRNEVFRTGIYISEITSATAGDDYFSTDFSIVFYYQRSSTAFRRFDGTQKPCRAATDDYYIAMHLSKISFIKDVEMVSNMAGHDECKSANGNFFLVGGPRSLPVFILKVPKEEHVGLTQEI